MTKKAMPLPSAGGSYTLAKGKLTPTEQPKTTEPAPKPAPSAPAQTPKKES